MRCFIAIDLPNEIKDYLYELQNDLRRLPAKIRWVEKKNLHLTIEFLGEINDDELNKIEKILLAIKSFSFDANLSTIGFFPNENHINVLWIGIEPSKKVVELQQKIDSELLMLFSKDQKFTSHLTLGRVKFVKNKIEFIKILKDQKINSIKFKINGFKLYKSILTKDGPIYEVLEEYKLL